MEKLLIWFTIYSLSIMSIYIFSFFPILFRVSDCISPWLLFKKYMCVAIFTAYAVHLVLKLQCVRIKNGAYMYMYIHSALSIYL